MITYATISLLKMVIKIMNTLHIRAEHKTINRLKNYINEISQNEQNIEVLDNFNFKQEQRIILKGLIQEQKGETLTHSQVWSELMDD